MQEPSDAFEFYADEFAQCLLMPEHAFRAEWFITGGSVRMVAAFFCVPTEKVVARARRLGLIKVGVQ